MESLEHAIRTVLNKFSAENASNTPDFILAQFLLGCLKAWDTGVQQRETWYGREARPSQGLLTTLHSESGEKPHER